MIERRLIGADGIDALATPWRDLAARSARSPFQSPAWLIPWLRHYGAGRRPVILTWWHGRDLVGVAPLVWRRGRVFRLPVRELELWGRTATPIAGWDDLVADDAFSAAVTDDFAAWLADPSADWDLFHYLHLAPRSPTLAALGRRRSGWWRVDLSQVLHSVEYEIDLPEDRSGWQGRLGPKARHEIRRQIRLFERRAEGRILEVTDSGEAHSIVSSLRSLLTEAWGDQDAYFRRDPSFEPFLADALGDLLQAGQGWVLLARTPRGVVACLVMLALGQRAVATIIGVSRDPEYRSMSLGKCLFHQAIDGAVARGCRSFSFLTESEGYKQSFWRAEGRPIESGFLARGLLGPAVAAAVTARRLAPARLRVALRGRNEHDSQA